MLQKSFKKLSKNIDFLMAWTLLIEAGTCTRARFSTFQPTTKNHQKSIPTCSNFGTQIDDKSIKKCMPKSDRKNDARRDATRRPRDPHLEAQNQKVAKLGGSKWCTGALCAVKMLPRWAQDLKILQKSETSIAKCHNKPPKCISNPIKCFPTNLYKCQQLLRLPAFIFWLTWPFKPCQKMKGRNCQTNPRDK